MPYKTTDLCDRFEGRVRLAAPVFRGFGRATAFSGRIATVRTFEDNVLVQRALEADGRGKVLVVDGGGSIRCALMGDRLVQIGIDHGWAGAIVHGCIRDAAEIDAMPFGIRALGACPQRSAKRAVGELDVAVDFAGITFRPGEFVYVDADGILVSDVACP
jgi:regulator of ribonuclease activity A